MKVVLVTIFILIITFLSQPIDITVEKGKKTLITVSLMLFSVTLTPEGSSQKRRGSIIETIEHTSGALRFLLRHSTVRYRYTRGLMREITIFSALSTPLTSFAIASYFALLSHAFYYSEAYDACADNDVHAITLSTTVIFLPISLTIFIYLRIKNALRKRLENVG